MDSAPKQASNAYIETYKSLNLDEMLKYWSDDLAFTNHEGDPISGKEEMRKFYEPIYENIEGVSLNIKTREFDVGSK